MTNGRMLMAGLGGSLAGAGAVALAGTTPASGPAATERAAMERVVHDYILAHPEIIPEAMTKLREADTARQIDASRKTIETPFAGAWAGNPTGDVTLVEFFDYACGYCRASVKDVDRLLAEDKGLKLVFRELPVLGPQSEVAARASLAAARQGRFLDFHRAMYAAGVPGTDKIAQAGRQAGIDPGRAAADTKTPAIDAEIAANMALGQTIGISGTPTWVVGDQMLNGAVGYDALKTAIVAARARRAPGGAG